MQLEFQKYQGTGNDFVIIDNRNLTFPKEDISLIEKICHRRWGIGADGLMLVENDDNYDFRMVYYNSDGKQSTMCGNGGRCIVAYTYKNGIAGKKGEFIAIDGPHSFVINESDEVKINMIDVKDIRKNGDDFILFTGSPHYVRFVKNVEELNVHQAGKDIRNSPSFQKEGINVNFVQNVKNSHILRTYERGVEDETLSCGTGTVAAAISIAALSDMGEGPLELNTKGGVLRVDFILKEGVYTQVTLEGPAQFVFKGTINLVDF